MEASMFLLIVALLILLGLFISAVMTRRAIFKVIEIFCHTRALGLNQAKTIDELGLDPPGFFQQLTQLRDYKPYALKILVEREIIRVTPSGELYLIEENLRRLSEGLRCPIERPIPP